MNLDEIVKRLSDLPRFRAGGPQDSRNIQKLETELGVRFPDDYREFLATCGCLVWRGVAVFGISPNPDLNIRERTRYWRNLTADNGKPLARGAVIGEYGGGGFYWLGESGKVIERLDEDGWQDGRTWESFLAYLSDIANKTLQVARRR